jgi:hypothetical protein
MGAENNQDGESLGRPSDCRVAEALRVVVVFCADLRDLPDLRSVVRASRDV